ncbi:hypothetical protein DS838_005030 [Geotrichum bryndzae]|nr:hypothetical protein DS838_005030 [Geotrichum bryndzae]
MTANNNKSSRLAVAAVLLTAFTGVDATYSYGRCSQIPHTSVPQNSCVSVCNKAVTNYNDLFTLDFNSLRNAFCTEGVLDECFACLKKTNTANWNAYYKYAGDIFKLCNKKNECKDKDSSSSAIVESEVVTPTSVNDIVSTPAPSAPLGTDSTVIPQYSTSIYYESGSVVVDIETAYVTICTRCEAEKSKSLSAHSIQSIPGDNISSQSVSVPAQPTASSVVVVDSTLSASSSVETISESSAFGASSSAAVPTSVKPEAVTSDVASVPGVSTTVLVPQTTSTSTYLTVLTKSIPGQTTHEVVTMTITYCPPDTTVVPVTSIPSGASSLPATSAFPTTPVYEVSSESKPAAGTSTSIKPEAFTSSGVASVPASSKPVAGTSTSIKPEAVTSTGVPTTVGESTIIPVVSTVFESGSVVVDIKTDFITVCPKCTKSKSSASVPAAETSAPVVPSGSSPAAGTSTSIKPEAFTSSGVASVPASSKPVAGTSSGVASAPGSSQPAVGTSSGVASVPASSKPVAGTSTSIKPEAVTSTGVPTTVGESTIIPVVSTVLESGSVVVDIKTNFITVCPKCTKSSASVPAAETSAPVVPAAETSAPVVPAAETSAPVVPAAGTSTSIKPEAFTSSGVASVPASSKPVAGTSTSIKPEAVTSTGVPTTVGESTIIPVVSTVLESGSVVVDIKTNFITVCPKCTKSSASVPAAETSAPVVPAAETSAPVVPAAETSAPVVPAAGTSTSIKPEAFTSSGVASVPASSKPVESTPASTPVSDVPKPSSPVESKPAESVPATPVNTKPVESVPATPVETKPVETAPPAGPAETSTHFYFTSVATPSNSYPGSNTSVVPVPSSPISQVNGASSVRSSMIGVAIAGVIGVLLM